MPYEECFNLSYLSEAPLINLSSGRRYYIEGSPVTMACKASGKPPPDVAWIRNGELESSKKEASFLKFDNISRTDAGQYTCQANNSVEVTSINTSIVVYCKYILTLIFYFWICIIYSGTPVIRASCTKLMNLFKSVRKQNATSNPFQLCMHWSQVLVGTIEFMWNHYSHYFSKKDMKIFLPSHSVGLCLTQEMAWSHLWVIVTTQNSLCFTSV